VQQLSEADEVEAMEHPALRRAEIHSEIDLVRTAMEHLPHDQRAVLTATVVDGKKPRELEDELSRPASAIYSLTSRAKANLRRTMLRLLLEENAPSSCRLAAQNLSDPVPNSPDDLPTHLALDHYQTCRRCRRAWFKFGSMSTLSLAGLLIVGDLILGPTSQAQANTDSPQTASDTPVPGVTPASGPSVPVSSGGAADGVQPVRANPTSLTSRWLLGGALATLAAGGTIAAFVLHALLTQQLWFAPQPTAYLEVQTEAITSSKVTFEVDFAVREESWRVQSLEIIFDEPVRDVSGPQGWECHASNKTVLCTSDLPQAAGGTFTITHSPFNDPTGWSFSLHALAEQGAEVVGTRSGVLQN
jgi:hypothetical protein